jgi:Zn finger protein HypA/HybF involved in hydrogenase expression
MNESLFDHAHREAKRIVGNAVARAYGYHREDDFAQDCPRCHGDGTITIGGQSFNPYSGTYAPDPQEAHDEGCPDCHGTGEATAYG